MMSTSEDSYDVIVIGAGVGGYTAAFGAAQRGLRVALVEEDRLGGTCLHRGCIPTKALLETAALAARVRQAGDFGLVLASEPSVDFVRVATRRDQVVDQMWRGLQGLVTRNGVHLVAGRGRLDGPGTVRVRELGPDGGFTEAEHVLEGRDVILATGSRVRGLPGLEPDGRRILTSDDVLKMVDLPASIAIIGAGAVGVEFASYFRDLGVDVTLLELLPAIVPAEDQDVSLALERSFARRGINVITNARVDPGSVSVTDDGVGLAVVRGGSEAVDVQVQALLIASGRAPNVEDIGLETTDIELRNGFVKVDGRMGTGEPHVYAIGDMVGGLQLAHTAAHEGLIAVRTIVGDEFEDEIDYVLQPRATYSRPEIASVGLTERECQGLDMRYRVGRVPFLAVAKAVIAGEPDGFCKVISDLDTGEVVGVHIIGPHATDLIAEATLAANLNLTPLRFGEVAHPHPSLTEIVAEAALAGYGRSVNFYSDAERPQA